MNVRILRISVHTDMELMKKIFQSFTEIVFPPTCICCGTSTGSEENHICSLCKTQRFEHAGYIVHDILPDTVTFVNTMWYFDKGGYLQMLLHKLKYHHIRGVGLEMGFMLGTYFLHNHTQSELDRMYELNPVLVPVPLHTSKIRKRGYNQAQVLAKGVANATGWEVIESSIITRIKNTQTQTGLNQNQRTENLRNAFAISDSKKLENRYPVIVDDVFTTGATTFELAKTIYADLFQKSGILTVARA